MIAVDVVVLWCMAAGVAVLALRRRRRSDPRRARNVQIGMKPSQISAPAGDWQAER